MHVDELIEGCLRGSRSHFSELYEQFAPMLYGICLRYSDDADEAQDIMQEGFIKVFMQLNTFSKERGALEFWLRKIFVNTAIDYYRKKPPLLNNIPLENLTEETEEEEGPFNDLSREQLLEMIRQLPAGYRTVFNLFAIEEVGHKEIAVMLGISENTSKTQLMKARRMLQAKIKQYLILSENNSR